MSASSRPIEFTEEERALIKRRGYRIRRQIGRGGFGVVYKGRWNGRAIAIKMLDIRRARGDFYAITSIGMELYTLKHCRHPNMVRMLDCLLLKSHYLLIFMEFLDGGDLHDLIEDYQLTEAQAGELYRQLGGALAYMHNRGLAHRDIKPDNVLLVSGWQVAKLADFGMTMRCYDLETGTPMLTDLHGGTLYYMAPEVTAMRAARKGFLPRRPPEFCPFLADVWSMGVMFYEILNHMFPFATVDLWTYQVTRWAICGFTFLCGAPDIVFKDEVSRSAKKFICRHLEWMPEDRVDIDELLEDPWLKMYKGADLTTYTRRPVEENATEAGRRRDEEPVVAGLEAGQAPELAKITESSRPNYPAFETPAYRAWREWLAQRQNGKALDWPEDV